MENILSCENRTLLSTEYDKRQMLLSKIAESVGQLDLAGHKIADGSPLPAIAALLCSRNKIDETLANFPPATIAAVQADLESNARRREVRGVRV